MVKFITLQFRPLPHEAHYKFFERVIRELAKSGSAVHTALGPLVAELNEWFAKETANVAWYRKSALTAVIARANDRLDHVISGMSANVNASKYSDDPDIVAAAKRLQVMLKSYGNVTRKPYLQEAGAVKAILAHLKGDLAVTVQTAGVADWTAKIEDALNGFVMVFEQREAQSLKKPQLKFSKVRLEIEIVWRRIAMIVNSGVALNISPDFEAFINALNPEIEYLNNEFRHAKIHIADAQMSAIEHVIYTGYPCTPVPDVFYINGNETVKLALGKDFNISYKNNVNPGNADCIIRGKGKYKGKKFVTFIIQSGSC
jgi:hypothetical protein